MSSFISFAALIEPQVLDPFLTPHRLQADDLPELAKLHGIAYANATHASEEAAASDFRAIVNGTLGAAVPQASLMTHDAKGRVTAAIVVTERTFRSDRPMTPFVEDLFTHPDYRRQGLADSLLSHAMQALHEAGHKTIAVTVDSSNAAAIALFLSRDFRHFTPAITGNIERDHA